VRVGEETLTSFNFCPLKVGGPLTQAFSAACQFSLCHSLSLSVFNSATLYYTKLHFLLTSTIRCALCLHFYLLNFSGVYWDTRFNKTR